MLAAMLIGAVAGFAQTTYQMVTSITDLEAGKNYLIVAENDGSYYVMGKQTNNNRSGVALFSAPSDNTISLTPAATTDEAAAYEFVLGGDTDEWTFFDAIYNGYLYAASSDANYLRTQETNDGNGMWSITFNTDGTAEVVAQGDNTRNNMRFNPNANNNNPLFSCYASTSNISTRVCLYKAGGATETKPEPTNYPTNFTAYNDIFDAVVTWADATGEQLPSGYLIMGGVSGTSFDMPVDGTPVANNTDNFIVNVPYGVETYTFTGLELEESYTFMIVPYTNSGASIDYKTDGTVPTASFTVNNMAMLLDEPFDEDLGVFTAISLQGDLTWKHDTHNDVNYAMMSGYANGASSANEDWLISPALNGNTPKVVLQFRTAKNYSGNALALKISTNYDGDPEEASWTDITDLFNWSTGSFNWVESGTRDITEYTGGGNFHIAFVYTCTDEQSSTWEIDYVRMIAADITGMAEDNATTFKVYPNPASQHINITAESNTTAAIFDATGRKVMEASIAKGENSINVESLENGVYFIMMDNAVSKFLKY